jgi:hypothetical protein
LEWAQYATVVGLVLQLGAGAVEGHDPRVVHVKGSEVAGDLIVECHGWPRGFTNSSITDYRFLGGQNCLRNLGCTNRDGIFPGSILLTFACTVV